MVGTVTKYNLTGLDPFTTYSLQMTVRGMNVSEEAPIDMNIYMHIPPQRTNTTGKENI